MKIRIPFCFVAALSALFVLLAACSCSSYSGGSYYDRGYYGSGFNDSYYYQRDSINIDNRPNNRPDRPVTRPSFPGGGGGHIGAGGGGGHIGGGGLRR